MEFHSQQKPLTNEGETNSAEVMASRSAMGENGSKGKRRDMDMGRAPPRSQAMNGPHPLCRTGSLQTLLVASNRCRTQRKTGTNRYWW